MATNSKPVIKRIESVYSKLKGKVFWGEFDGIAPLHGPRNVIKIDESEKEMIEDLTSILDMDDGDNEMVWKAITHRRKSKGGTRDGTKLWCNENSKTKGDSQRYRIIKFEVVHGTFDRGYKAIVDVHVDIVKDEKPENEF